MTFLPVDGSRRIEELVLPYDESQVLEKVRRRRRRMRSQVFSLIITAVILVVIYLWQRDQMAGRAYGTLYAVVLGISVAFLVVYLVRYLLAKRELARVGTGTALRIDRHGVEVSGTFVPWPEVRSLAVAGASMGRSPVLRVERTSGTSISVPLNQMQVRPATLDLTARAYSAGRHGVDLQALDS
jgi:predicted nucleic acid-binding Zn ribbon protein